MMLTPWLFRLFSSDSIFDSRGYILTVEGAVLYRDQDDSLNGGDRGLEADLSVEWLIRETELRLTYEYGEYSDRFSENDFSSIWLRVRRSF